MYDILVQEESISPNEVELQELKSSLEDTPPVGVIVNCCKTLDQVQNVNLCFKEYYRVGDNSVSKPLCFSDTAMYSEKLLL